MPWLTTEGASHQISDGETIVGSGAHAGWRLASHGLAARHFIVERQAGRVTVRPFGPDAIIAVNGVQSGAQPVELHDGANVDAGSVRFLFSSERSGSYPAASVGPAHLVESRGGTAHALETPSVGIGRDRLNSVVVRDPTASRFHAEIRREAGGYVLHPHGSSGTLVNGRRIGSPERLRDGDRIEIGNVELRFVAGPIPPGTVRSSPVLDDEASRRPTMVGAPAVQIPGEDAGRPKWLLWLGMVVVLAAIAALVVATNRRG